MSVSIDEPPADDPEGADEGARSVLAGWLDDYAAGRCERADMEEAFLSVCRADAEASWDALALLDQYQRLKKVEVELARDLKSKIAQLAVGAPKQAARKPSPTPPPPPAPETLVSSGTRWRQIVSEHDPEAINTDDIDASQTRLRTPAPAPAPNARITRMQPMRPHEDVRESEEDEDEELDEVDEADEAADPHPVPPDPVLHQTRSFADKAREVRQAAPRRVDPPVEPRFLQPKRVEPRVRPAPGAPPAKRVLRDRYELLSVLARGASSTVYKALDRHRANLSESARYVAIKVLNASYETRAEALAQLEREFHQAQSLSHPNIASVFDLDKDNGTYFIVMELLEGDLLASVLRRLDNRPMARKHALGLINNIGAALAYAHRREIAHGDLKPRNVMITSDGEVRVLEFGFSHSRSLQAGELDGAHEGVAIGTPAYATSERVHGFEPDPSDDVYSLACIAYELLSGRHPYGGRSALLARAHGKRAQRISWLTHRQWHALQRALAWDRADRKIEVADLLVALGAAESNSEPVPPELLAIPDDSRGRRRRLLGVLAGFAIAIALIVYFIDQIPAPLQAIDPSTAVSPPSKADSELLDSNQQPANRNDPAPQSTSQSAASTGATTQPPRTQAAPPATEVVPESELATAPAASSPDSPSSRAARSGSIQFEKDTFVVTESDGTVSVQVRRSGSTRGVLSFRWTLRGNSAEAGADYAGIGPGLEQIPSGVSTATVMIPLVSDALVENTELFLVEIEALDEGVTVGELGHAAVIIVDDD